MPIDLDRLRSVVSRVRDKADPIRTTSVTIRTRTFSAQLGVGTPGTSDLALGALKVRDLGSKEIRDSGGRYGEGSVMVGPIDPSFFAGGGGGFTIAQITAVGTALQEIVWMLSGGVTGEYRLADCDTSKPFRYMAVLNRMRTTP